MSKPWTMYLPQFADPGIYGDRVELDHDGTLTISRYDGITQLTPQQALALAAALTEFAALGEEQDPAP